MMEVKNMKGKKFKSQKGQSFVEYALILVAVLVFGAFLILTLQQFGPRIAATVECVIVMASGANEFTPEIEGLNITITNIGNCRDIIFTE